MTTLDPPPLTPRSNPHVFGHDAAQSAILDALRAGRMHHAWLIEGPPGIGKATLAYRTARRLFAGPDAPDAHVHDPDRPLFRRVAKSTHADLLTIERETDPKGKRRAEIVVSTVRNVPEFLHMTPVEGGWRIVIVDGAETLNRNAANALLKALEEPPARAVLLLTCAAPGRLLPTIRSRCRRLTVRKLDDAAMAQALPSVLPDATAEQRTRLIALADGSPGRAVALAGYGLEVAELVTEALRGPVPPPRAQAMADKLARHDEGFAEFMTQIRDSIAAATRQAARSPSAVPLASRTDLWHALGHLQDETERFHLDKRQAIGLALQKLGAS